MKIKGKYSESTILHAIILSAAAVISIVVFFVVLNITGGKIPQTAAPGAGTAASDTDEKPDDDSESRNEDGSGSDGNTGTDKFEADEALATEMQDAVIKLIQDNYTVLRAYYTKGMDHKDEPYGNAPEDGYYSVDTDKYSSLDELEAIVDRTYIAEVAEQIKTDSLGYGAVYKTRDNGDMGIIANFTPMEYTRTWASPTFKVLPVSETECDIIITIHDKADGNAEVKVDATMVKTDGSWKLTSVIF